MEYGLIGEHLSDSFSQFVHERIASYNLASYRYELQELRAEQVEDYLCSARFKGINVAEPYQQAVVPCLDEISDPAREIGAVDTIIKRGGKLSGTNTAYTGLRDLLQHEEHDYGRFTKSAAGVKKVPSRMSRPVKTAAMRILSSIRRSAGSLPATMILPWIWRFLHS